MASSSKVTLEASTKPDVDDHLSYPSEIADEVLPPLPINPTKQVLKDRIYVGNLHSTVDEYTLLNLFKKYGKITQCDFLYHKSGPLKGKPRGFAFIEFAESHEADAALLATNGKPLRGQKLVVTYANQAPVDSSGMVRRKTLADSAKPTALSLIKSGRKDSASTNDKIAKMEAKLLQMERTREDGSLPPPSALHSSLPAKPIPSGAMPERDSEMPQAKRRKMDLPSFAELQKQKEKHKQAQSTKAPASSGSVKSTGSLAAKKSSLGLGIKFKKPNSSQTEGAG